MEPRSRHDYGKYRPVDRFYLIFFLPLSVFFSIFPVLRSGQALGSAASNCNCAQYVHACVYNCFIYVARNVYLAVITCSLLALLLIQLFYIFCRFSDGMPFHGTLAKLLAQLVSYFWWKNICSGRCFYIQSSRYFSPRLSKTKCTNWS